MEVLELWKSACKYLAEALGKDTYTRWIEIIVPKSYENGKLVLSVDNEFQMNWLKDNFQPAILDALRIVCGEPEIEIVFKVESVDQNTDRNPDVILPRPMPEDLPPQPKTHHLPEFEQTPLSPGFTFENFVTGPSNSFAHAAALGVSQAPGRAYNPLFIYGETGIGKTHLMQAIGHRVLENNSRARVSYISSETLLNEYIDSLKTGTSKAFREKYRNTDVLMVDDIQFLAGKNALQEEFFHTFNELHAARKQIIMTSDLPPKELKGLEPRLVSRFEWGLVTQIECPDFETRLAILRYKQTSATVQLPDALLTFIADHITSNVRSLEGALNKAVSFVTLTGQELTIDALRNLLKDQINGERQKDLSFDDIQRVVAEHFGLTMSDMSSKSRPRSVAEPRQIAMYLCRKLTRSSLPEIAKAFDKTHATVVHACKTIQDRMQVQEDLKESVRELVRVLGRDDSMLQ